MNRGVNYRQSLPGSSASMTPVTPLQLSSSTRKRKRGLLDSIESSAASEVKFHEEDEFDKFSGEVKKVIVIDDDSTPEPSPPANLASVAGRLNGAGLRSGNGLHHLGNGNSNGINGYASTSIYSSSNGSSRTASFTAPNHPHDQFIAANGFTAGQAAQAQAVLRQPARTRAQVAAATAALKENAAASFQAAPPPPKRRRRDPPQAVGSSTAGQTLPTRKPFPQITNKPWPSTSTDVSAVSSTTSKGAPACDDKEGHYIVTADDVVGKRYRIVKLLGQGTFGKVVEAVETHSQKRAAIKIIRAIPKYREASTIEIRVLRLLKERDPHNMHKCIHLLETFDHRNHVCIVTELLGMCIYDFLKENDFRPFPRAQIQQFARQLLSSVAFLHDLQLIHTDLKPENILLVNSASRVVTEMASAPGRRPQAISRKILFDTDIRLIDFGSATFEREYHSSVVSTRHYRAPEIILGLGWSYPCDAFSLGCIFVEFYTGVALYQTHDNLEHLAMMEMVMGRMPDRFAREGAGSKSEYFKDGARLDWPKPKATKQSRRDVKSTKALHEIIRPQDQFNRHFLDLVRQLLDFDPAIRITVRRALEHSYFSVGAPNEA